MVWKASSAWRKDYYRKKIQQYQEYLGGKCARCGSVDDLEFDHIDSSTKCFEITSRHDWQWLLVKEELDKCQLLCRPCHRLKGLEVGDIKQAQHGTCSMYTGHRCRCEACKKAWNEYMNALKMRLRRARKATSVEQSPV